MIGAYFTLSTVIKTIDMIVFGPGFSRKEDERNFNETKNKSGETSKGPSVVVQEESTGLFQCLSVTQLMNLVEVLIESHRFAKTFNANEKLRNGLWKAGFKGKDKPNLLSQEKASLACALRILFRMYSENGTLEENRTRICAELNRNCKEALGYYLSFKSDQYRDSWTPVVLLLICRLKNLGDKKMIGLVDLDFGHLIMDVASSNALSEVRSTYGRCAKRIMDLRIGNN